MTTNPLKQPIKTSRVQYDSGQATGTVTGRLLFRLGKPIKERLTSCFEQVPDLSQQVLLSRGRRRGSRLRFFFDHHVIDRLNHEKDGQAMITKLMIRLKKMP